MWIALCNPQKSICRRAASIFFVWGHPDSPSLPIASNTRIFIFSLRMSPVLLGETDPILSPGWALIDLSQLANPWLQGISSGMIMWLSWHLLDHRRNFQEDPASSVEMSLERHLLLVKYECGSMDTIEGSQLWVKVASKKKVKKKKLELWAVRD